MRYITSKDYDRLVELLDNREHVIILTGIRSYFASYDKYKGYYIGNTWLEHDIEFCLFHSKDKEELKDFCAQEECEFIDPDFAEEMLRTFAGICLEKSAMICEYRPESCEVCQINKILKKAEGEK